MVSFEDPPVFVEFMDSRITKPMAFKIDSEGRPVYQSFNDFGPLKSLRSIPQLVDFGVATRLEEDDDWGVWPIQPGHYRTPEVILGIGWQMHTDIDVPFSSKVVASTHAKPVVGHDRRQGAVSAYPR